MCPDGVGSGRKLGPEERPELDARELLRPLCPQQRGGRWRLRRTPSNAPPSVSLKDGLTQKRGQRAAQAILTQVLTLAAEAGCQEAVGARSFLVAAAAAALSSRQLLAWLPQGGRAGGQVAAAALCAAAGMALSANPLAIH